MRAAFVDESVGAGLISLHKNHHRHVSMIKCLYQGGGYEQRCAWQWSCLDADNALWVQGAAI